MEERKKKRGLHAVTYGDCPGQPFSRDLANRRKDKGGLSAKYTKRSKNSRKNVRRGVHLKIEEAAK